MQSSHKKERVSVVIVTFNNAEMLADLINDLHAQIRLPDEIIVIDNGNPKYTEKMIRANYPEVSYVKLQENTGSAGGYYEGIKLAAQTSDFIYTLDDDVRMKPDTLSEIIKGFYLLETSTQSKIAAVRSVGEKHPELIATQMDFYTWRGTLFKTSVFREEGLPLPDFFIYGEDLEYSLRLAKKGYRFYWVPESICQERNRAQNGKTHAEVFGRRSVRYQDPFRLYYAFRNEIFIYRQYNQIIKLIYVVMYAIKVTLMILREERWDGRRSVMAIADGMIDGVMGRLGNNIKYTPA